MTLRRLTIVLLTLAACMLHTACEEEDFVSPAFLSIDSIQVVPSPTLPFSSKEGFSNAEIVSCFLEVLPAGGDAIQPLGLFELPFTAPILLSGDIEYLVVSPAIKISGVSGMQNYYPFYTRDTIRNLTLQPGDTLRLDTLRISHRLTLNNILLFEPFEYSPETPTTSALALDSVTWHPNAADEACSGNGYVSVHVADTLQSVPFAINRDFYAADPTGILYLELDTRSDLPFEVYLQSRYTVGGAIDRQRVMVVNPSSHWQHLYINLGRTWAWFNYHPSFQISFAALNVYNQQGDIRLDNVKVLYSNSAY